MAQPVIRYCATFHDYFLRLRERGKSSRAPWHRHPPHKLLNVLVALIGNHTSSRVNYDPSICDS